jgi:hypothetical protein
MCYIRRVNSCYVGNNYGHSVLVKRNGGENTCLKLTIWLLQSRKKLQSMVSFLKADRRELHVSHPVYGLR